MPEAVATLGLVVDSTGALTANDALKKLTATGAQAEQRTESLAATSRRLSESQTQVARAATESTQRTQALSEVTARQTQAARQWAAMSEEARQRQVSLAAAVRESGAAVTASATAAARTAAATTEVGRASVTTATGIKSLREPLTTVIAQMTSMSPVGARLTSVLGSMALGSATMVGVLAGVAALGIAYNKLTEDSRRLREEEEKRAEGLKALVQAQQSAALGTVGSAQQQLDQLNIDNAPMLARVAAAQRQLAAGKELQQLVGSGQGAGIAAGMVGGAQAAIDKDREALQAYTLAEAALKHVITQGTREQEASLETFKRRGDQQRELTAAMGEGELAARLINLRYQEQAELADLLIGGDAKLVAQKRQLIEQYYAQARAAAVLNAEQEKSARMTEVEVGPVIGSPLNARLGGRGDRTSVDLGLSLGAGYAAAASGGIIDMTPKIRERLNLEDMIQRSVKRTTQAIHEQAEAERRAADVARQRAEAIEAQKKAYIAQSITAASGAAGGYVGEKHEKTGAAIGVAGAAAAGFVVGGPVGAAVAGGAALVTSLFGIASASRAAAEAERKRQEQLERAARDFDRDQTQNLELRRYQDQEDILRSQGKTAEADAQRRKREQRELEIRQADEIKRWQEQSSAFGSVTLAEILYTQELDRNALAARQAADEVRRLTGDLNGPQGLRRSLYLWRVTGDSSLWGPNMHDGTNPVPRSGSGATQTVTEVTNVYIDGSKLPASAGMTPGQILDTVIAERNRRAKNGGPDPLMLVKR